MSPHRECIVIDVAYVLGTIGFFLVMQGYVVVCARLGSRTATGGSEHTGESLAPTPRHA